MNDIDSKKLEIGRKLTKIVGNGRKWPKLIENGRK